MGKDVLKGRSIVNRNVFDIANQSVEELKRSNPLAEYLRSKGVKLEKSEQPDKLKGVCMFCRKSAASLFVNEAKGEFYCVACGKTGTVIDIAAFYEKVSTDEAGRILSKKIMGAEVINKTNEAAVKDDAAQARTVAERVTEPERHDESPALPAPEPPRDEINIERNDITPPAEQVTEAEKQELLQLAVEEMHKNLLTSAEALAYLERRKLKDFDLLARLKMGFCDGKSITDKCSEHQKKVFGAIGFIKDGKECLAGQIVVPVFREDGSVAGLRGLRIGSGEPNHLYFDGQAGGVFNPAALRVYESILMTGSIVDALSLMVLGFQNVSAWVGREEAMLAALKQHRVKEVVLAFDSPKLKDRLVGEGFTIKIILPPSGKDWNDSLRAGVEKSAIQKLIDEEPAARRAEAPADYTVVKEQERYLFTFPDTALYTVINFRRDFVANLRIVLKCVYFGKFHCDNMDLYSHRQREGYAKTLEYELGIPLERGTNELHGILEHLEKLRDDYFKDSTDKTEEKKSLTEDEIKTGMDFLRDPNLFDVLKDDLTDIGCVGEDVNKVVLYLALTSRIRANPLSTYIMGRSSAGKNWLAKCVLQLIPDEGKFAITKVSPEVLYYMQEGLSHKAVMLGEFEGAEDIEYLLRELISDGYVSKLVLLKDTDTGQSKPFHIVAKGPISFVSTTTDPDLNPENLSRCLLLHIDESREQTQRILEHQRFAKSKEGYLTQVRAEEIIRKHHIVQRLLSDIVVFNTFADELDFPTLFLLVRRAHFNFLLVLEMAAFMFQEQHEKKQLAVPGKAGEITYIETDLRDYEITYRLMMSGIMENTLDEIPKNARDLHGIMLKIVEDKAAEEGKTQDSVFVERREVLELSGWSVRQVKAYLRVLVEYGFLEVVSGKVPGQRHKYRVLRVANRVAELLKKIPTPEEMSKRLRSRQKAGPG